MPPSVSAWDSMRVLGCHCYSSRFETAGNLSSMAQATGYLVAAPFPWFIGWLSAVTGSWIIAYGFLAIPVLLLAVAGVLAGRTGVVS